MPQETIIPRVPENASDEHEFHVLGPRRFEHLVRALHEAEPEVFGSHLYGPDGQGQYGADHIAYHRTDSAPYLEVGQSKAYRTYGPSQLIKAAKDFTDHWESHWQSLNVRKFILFVGCAIKSQKAHDAIISLTRSFAELGVEFSVWDANTIYDRLALAPGVVRGHLNQRWYSALFGEPVGPLTGLLSDLQRGERGALAVGAFVARLNQAETAEIAELRHRVRRGETEAVIAELDALLTGPPAAATAPEVRAAQQRLLGGLLVRRDSQKAQRLLDEADAQDGDSHRLRSILLLETVGPAAALVEIQSHAEPGLAEIRAIAQLRLGDLDTAYAELAPHVDAEAPSAETLRIAALIKLIAGDRDTALVLAERALAKDSESRVCAQAVALCHFHLALSPAADTSVGEWPQPIDQPLVGSSTAALEHLELARAGFASLMRDPALDEHRSMVMWHFASLACIPSRRAEAEARIAELQNGENFPIPLAAWCVSRGLTFDRSAAAAACDTQMARDPKDYEALLIRVALATNAREFRHARDLLSASKEMLFAAGYASLFEYWNTVLDLETRKKPADVALGAHPGLALRSALDVRNKKRRLKRIAALLESQLIQNGDPRIILATSQLLLESGWYKTAVKASAYLLDRIATGEAIAVAAHSLYRADRFSETLKALERVDAFLERTLPVDLARLRTECLAGSGDLVGARRASLILAQTTGHERDVWRSIQFHLATGAAPAALALYEQHETLLDSPSADHVVLARAVLQTHPKAAAKITRRIAASAPDDLVTAAYALASKLRLDDEQRTLIGRIQELGRTGSGGVQMIAGLDEVIAMAQAHRQQTEQAFEQYASGHIPIYFLAGFREAGFALNYLAPLLEPPPAHVRTAIFPMRYGRRYDRAIWPENQADVKLLVDLTALLTAHGLDLLDTVERAFAPLHIAPDTVNAILTLRSDVEVVQPERVSAARCVVAAADQEEIALKGITPQVDAYTVLWEMEGGEPDSTLNFTRLVEQLLPALHASKRDTAQSALGRTIDTPGAGAIPARTALLNLDGTMAVTLEEAGLFSAAVSRFNVVLDGDEVARLRQEVSDAETRERVVSSLTALAERIGIGLDDGVYRTAAISRVAASSPVVRSFFQLLDAMRAEDAILWIDDRFVSAIDNPKFRIVTTIEVLGALKRYSRLARPREIALRQQLRAARAQFIPPEPDELVTVLRAATHHGAVVETADIVTLRRYTGEMLRHRRRLQWPAPDAASQGLKGEVPYLLDTGHAVAQALSTIWNTESWTIEDAAAASSWILEHLDHGLYPLPVLGAGDPRSDQLIGTHIGALILAALQVKPGKIRNPRQISYMKWLLETVVRNALRCRPEFRATMEAMIEDHLLLTDGGKLEEPLWLAIAGNMLNSMPEELRIAMLGRKGIRDGFNLPEHGMISVEQYEFDELEFWAAVAGTRRGRPKSIKAHTGETARISIVENDSHIVLEVANRSFRLDAWVWAIAQDDEGIRARALSERADRLDLSPGSLRALGIDLASLRPVDRIRHALSQERNQALGWYVELEEKVRQRTPIFPTDFAPPDVSQLPRLLRLNDDLEAAAATLVAERGLAIAIRRFAALPIVPPRALTAEVEALDDAAIATLLDDMNVDTAPPWTQLFLARCLTGRPQGPAEADARIRYLIDQALGDSADGQWMIYSALANFVAREGPTQLAWRDLNARQQLAACWLHAAKVAEAVIAGSVRLDGLVDLINGTRFVPPRVLVEPTNAFAGDRADPRHTNSARLKAFGAAPSLARYVEMDGARSWAQGKLREIALRDGQIVSAINFEISLAEGGLQRGDALTCTFAADWTQLFEDAAEGSGALFGHGLEALVLSVVTAEHDLERPSSGWPFVRYATGDAPLPDTLSEPVRAAALSPLARDGRTDVHALLALAAVAALNGWSEHEGAIAAAFEAVEPSALGPDEEPMDLLELAIWHAMFEPDPVLRAQIAARHFDRLQRSDTLRPQIEETARRFATGLSGQESEGFVDVLAAIWSSH